MSAPRVAPGRLGEVGVVAWLLSRAGGRQAHTEPLNLFLTLGRHKRLFRGWLHFAGRLMPGGVLPRAESELLILRVAHLRASAYEQGQHRRIGLRAGLTPAEIERVEAGPDAPGWPPRRRALLRAADALVHERDLDDDTWTRLREHVSEREAIEVVLLVGHYDMLAAAIAALRIQPERPPAVTAEPGGRLPSGRAAGRLTKEQVSRHQRERLLYAMVATVGEIGYAATTVTDLIRRAGVSRATFYQRFADRQDCFFAAFDWASEVVVDLLRGAGTEPGGVEALLRVYLETIVGEPDIARVLLVESSALGAPGIVRRAENQRRFTDVVVVATGTQSDDGRFACEAFVAAVANLVTARLAENDLDGVTALHAPLAGLARRLLHPSTQG